MYYFCGLIFLQKMNKITIKDKQFEIFIPRVEIEDAIDRIAAEMNDALKNKDPLFICVLNGSFMFASELMKRINIPSEITFVKMSSYVGTSSTGTVKEIYGLQEEIAGRTLVIVEDIIDTGNTMVQMLKQLENKKPREILVSSLLLKPEALKHDVPLDYIALHIPDNFVVGYGLDYDGYGRNLPNIYKYD